MPQRKTPDRGEQSEDESGRSPGGFGVWSQLVPKDVCPHCVALQGPQQFLQQAKDWSIPGYPRPAATEQGSGSGASQEQQAMIDEIEEIQTDTEELLNAIDDRLNKPKNHDQGAGEGEGEGNASGAGSSMPNPQQSIVQDQIIVAQHSLTVEGSKSGPRPDHINALQVRFLLGTYPTSPIDRPCSSHPFVSLWNHGWTSAKIRTTQ